MLDALYSPLIRVWIRRAGVQAIDEDDLVQEVFIQVIKKIDTFERGPHTGSFRRWLKQVTINCFRNFVRLRGNKALATGGSETGKFLQQCEDPVSPLSRIWDQEHEQNVMRYLLSIVEPHFQPATWQAFYQTTVKNRPATDVALTLDMSVGAVHTSKSRVLSELRRIGKGLLNDDPDHRVTV